MLSPCVHLDFSVAYSMKLEDELFSSSIFKTLNLNLSTVKLKKKIVFSYNVKSGFKVSPAYQVAVIV